MKSRAVLVLILGLLVVQNSCWSGRELNQRAFIIAISFDLPKPGSNAAPGEFVTSIQIPVPQEMGSAGEEKGSSQPFLVLGTVSSSVSSAILQLQQQIDRRLFLGHTRLILIGEELAREIGVERIFDFFKREFKIQRVAKAAIVEGEAHEILTLKPPMGQSPSTYILNLISPIAGSSLLYPSDLGKFFVQNADEGLDPALPKVRKGVGDKTIITGGAGVIKSGKLVGWLTPFETRGLNILSNQFTESDYDLDCPLHPSELISVKVVQATACYHFFERQGSLELKITVDGSFDTREFSGEHGPTEEFSTQLNKLVSVEVQRDCQEALSKAQLMGADIVGIGKRINSFYPKRWKEMDWGKEFSFFPVEIEVKMNWSRRIRRLGR